MEAPEKPLVCVGTTLERLRAFPAGARREAGHQLHRVQCRLGPGDWRPMPTVGAGVVELRVHAEGEFRVCYVASFAEAVYALHAFQKKTRRTPRVDIEIARRNFAALRRARLTF